MAKPTRVVREGVYWRDQNACCSCGRTDGLTFQHRRAVGAGGSKLPPTFADGLAACAICNMRFESDLQDEAIAKGWKVPRKVADPARVPYFHALAGRWFVLSDDGPWRAEITSDVAQAMMLAVYGPEGSYV